MTQITIRDDKIETQKTRRSNTTIDLIIIHAMSEYLINENGETVFAVNFLNEIQLGCHYFISPDGSVINGVHPDWRTPHVGRSEFKGRKWLNETSIGIEFLVQGINTYGEFLQALRLGDPFTDEQYSSGAELVASLREKYKMPLERTFGHDAVSGDDVRGEGRGKQDPGPNFNWSSFQLLIGDNHE